MPTPISEAPRASRSLWAAARARSSALGAAAGDDAPSSSTDEPTAPPPPASAAREGPPSVGLLTPEEAAGPSVALTALGPPAPPSDPSEASAIPPRVDVRPMSAPTSEQRPPKSALAARARSRAGERSVAAAVDGGGAGASSSGREAPCSAWRASVAPEKRPRPPSRASTSARCAASRCSRDEGPRASEGERWEAAPAGKLASGEACAVQPSSSSGVRGEMACILLMHQLACSARACGEALICQFACTMPAASSRRACRSKSCFARTTSGLAANAA